MRLFHGSTVTVKRPNIQKGRKATDFGKGFYTTTNFEQAKKWALLKKNREQSEKAIVSVYEVPDDIPYQDRTKEKAGCIVGQSAIYLYLCLIIIIN